MKRTRRVLAIAAAVVAAATTLPNLAGAAPTDPCSDFVYEGPAGYVIDDVAPTVHQLVFVATVYLDDSCTTVPANDRFQLSLRLPPGNRSVVAEPVSVIANTAAPTDQGTSAENATAISFRVPLGLVVDGVGSRDYTGRTVLGRVELLDAKGRVVASAPGTEDLVCRNRLALEPVHEVCDQTGGGTRTWN